MWKHPPESPPTDVATPDTPPSQSDPRPVPSANTPPSGRRSIHWLLEGLLIVVSVVLGFSLTSIGDARKERAFADRVVAGLHAEVDFNRKTLEPYIPMHRAWQKAMAAEDPLTGTASAIETLLATRPPAPPEVRTNVPLLRRAAWDTALSTGALRLIDYDLVAGLSEIYAMQDYAGTTFLRTFSDTASFDPKARPATLRLAQTTMQEIVWAEGVLMGLYEKHLPALRISADVK